MTMMMKVIMVANEAHRVIIIVPALWYDAPHIPKSTESPASPAAMGWRTRVLVRLLMIDVFILWPLMKHCQMDETRACRE
jgi:hypothetical protein